MDPVGRLRREVDRHLGGFGRSVYVVSMGQFVNVFGSGVVYPFATVYFVGELGIAFTLIGAGLFANSIARGIGTALGGYFADRLGRDRVMVVSMALSAIALSAYALVRSATGFAIVATAAGLVAGLYTPASHAMVADLTGDEDRERAYGLLKVANNLGFGMGFVTGGVLYGIANVAVFVVDGATSGVVAIILLVLLPRTVPDGAPTALRDDIGQWGRAIGEPRLVHLALLNVIFAIAYAQMQSTVPVFATETLGVTSEELGTLFVLNPLVIVLFQLPMVSWVARWRRTRGLLLSTVFWAVSFAAIILANTGPRFFGIAMIGAFLVLRTMGEILHSPLATSIASDIGSAAERGSQLSMVEIAKRLGFGIGPLVGGAFFDAGLESLLWPVLIGMCGLLALGVLLLERRITPAENGLSSA